MIDRIGKRRPPRLFIREWMEEKRLNNKTLAGRMGRSEGTVSKLLAQADPEPKARGSKLKITVEYLAEFALALNLLTEDGDPDVRQLFRDPKQPSREELLRGYSNAQVAIVLQLLKTASSGPSFGTEPDIELPSERPAAASTRKRAGAR